MNLLLFITLIVQFIVGMMGISATGTRRDETFWVITFVLIFIVSLTVASTLWFTDTSEPQTQVIHSNCGCEK